MSHWKNRTPSITPTSHPTKHHLYDVTPTLLITYLSTNRRCPSLSVVHALRLMTSPQPQHSTFLPVLTKPLASAHALHQLRYSNTLLGTLWWTHTSGKMLLRIARSLGSDYSHCTPNSLENYQSTTTSTLYRMLLQYVLFVILFEMRDSNYNTLVCMCY